jgi:hypothetical protein
VARESSLIVGGLALAITAKSLQYAVQAYNAKEANKNQATVVPDATDSSASSSKASSSTSPSSSSTSSSSSSSSSTTTTFGSKANAKSDTKNASFAAAGTGEPSMFTSWFARTFYDGGFEDKMSRREAALILGVRESATPERIKDAHRKVLILNHPDRGGSAYIAAKINEAKDLLMKSKSS